MLDDHDRVAGVDEPVQRADQHRDVRGVQPGRRLVEQVERPGASPASASARASFSRCASPPESVGAGCDSDR